MGIPVEGPTCMFCDNESVVKSTSRLEARLNKKHQSICWHAVREAVAAGWLRIGKEPSATNIADMFTKAMDKPKKDKLLEGMFPAPYQ